MSTYDHIARERLEILFGGIRGNNRDRAVRMSELDDMDIAQATELRLLKRTVESNERSVDDIGNDVDALDTSVQGLDTSLQVLDSRVSVIEAVDPRKQVIEQNPEATRVSGNILFQRQFGPLEPTEIWSVGLFFDMRKQGDISFDNAGTPGTYAKGTTIFFAVRYRYSSGWGGQQILFNPAFAVGANWARYEFTTEVYQRAELMEIEALVGVDRAHPGTFVSETTQTNIRSLNAVAFAKG